MYPRQANANRSLPGPANTISPANALPLLPLTEQWDPLLRLTQHWVQLLWLVEQWGRAEGDCRWPVPELSHGIAREGDMDDESDVARLVVRVRRMADLSQRDLAARLGTSPSTVARIETGSCSVSVGLLMRILQVGGLRLAAVGGDGVAVTPVAADVLRDNGGRRFPAHLDVDPPAAVPKLRRLMPRRDRPPAKGWYRQRPLRDDLRRVEGVPTDHPTHAEVREVEARERDQRARLRLLLARAAPAPPECTCPTSCLLDAGCRPACPCQCEPVRPSRHRRE